MDEMQKLSVGEPEFLDLKDPGSTRPASTPRTSAPPSALLTGRCLRRHEHRSVLTHLKDVVASRPVTLATTSRQAPPTTPNPGPPRRPSGDGNTVTGLGVDVPEPVRTLERVALSMKPRRCQGLSPSKTPLSAIAARLCRRRRCRSTWSSRSKARTNDVDAWRPGGNTLAVAEGWLSLVGLPCRARGMGALLISLSPQGFEDQDDGCFVPVAHLNFAAVKRPSGGCGRLPERRAGCGSALTG
jgi:hypothetical protein